MELRESGPTTLPAPGSLSPLQDETPGRAKHSCLGQSKNIEDTAMEETGGPCLFLPQPPPITHTLSHTLTSPKAVPASSFQKGSRQTSSVLTLLLKPILGSQGPQGPCFPAHKGKRQKLFPCACAPGYRHQPEPPSSLRYLGNPGPHPAQMPSPGQLPRATPGPQIHPCVRVRARTHTITITQAGHGSAGAACCVCSFSPHLQMILHRPR